MQKYISFLVFKQPLRYIQRSKVAQRSSLQALAQEFACLSSKCYRFGIDVIHHVFPFSASTLLPVSLGSLWGQPCFPLHVGQPELLGDWYFRRGIRVGWDGSSSRGSRNCPCFGVNILNYGVIQWYACQCFTWDLGSAEVKR